MDFIKITELNPKSVPDKIFIVPYRNRIQHKFFFSKHMSFILEDEISGSYEIYFSHQSDDRPFNRGATKNIGFLAMKQKYPNHYKNITFIFNDVDTIPFDKIFDYNTTHGVVQHLYGFNFALGGIVIFKGSDFEKINGYPNYWGWGMEDNVLQQRCKKYGLTIDRSQFVEIGCQDILQLFDGIKRVVARNGVKEAKQDNGIDGLRTIHHLNYTINTDSNRDSDNVHVVDSPFIFYLNINYFLTLTSPEEKQLEVIDLRDKPRHLKDHESPLIGMNLSTKQEFNQKKLTKKNSDIISPSVNIYSPQYAKQMNVKPRASTSVNIRMGGFLL